MEDDEQMDSLVSALDAAVTAEKRVAALHSIQSYLLEIEDITHADHLTTSLKVQIKNQNQLVSSTTLSILPIYVSKLAAHHRSSRAQDVKALLLANLSIVLEKLGDQKEKIREGAKTAIVEMARAAFSVSPPGSTMAKDSHSASGIFERLYKEGGILAKSAKVKEQATLVMTALRQAVDRFPLRPFLPSLVDQLSDADPGVREAARGTCITLFSSASPTAKSELKKEMEKKAVRKQTADAILAQVLGSAVEQDHNTESRSAMSTVEAGPSAARPGREAEALLRKQAPSNAPRSGGSENADDGIKPVYIASQWDLERTLTGMLPHFEGKETEHNWLAREQSIITLRGTLRTGTHERYPDGFLNGLKSIHEGILKATASLRTTLSMHGLQLISELAKRMGESLDSLAEPLIASIIKMAGFTKKIVANASQVAVQDILINVSYRHKYLEMIWHNLQEKTVTTRAFMCGHLITILDTHGHHRKHALEGHGGLEVIERFCKKALPDQNKDVREKARAAFYLVETIWPTLGQQLLDSLDAATRKQVESNRGKATVSSEPGGNAGQGPALAPVAAPQPHNGTPGRRAGGPGPSSAILAAKRAAAMRLAQERREREEAEAEAEAEAAARQDDEAEARGEETVAERKEEEEEEEEEESYVSGAGATFPRGYDDRTGEEERLWREAENEAEADASQQLLDEQEEEDEAVHSTPARSGPLAFPPIPTPKSPLRSSVGPLKGRVHSPLTPSSIPLPISPPRSVASRTATQQVEGYQGHPRNSLALSASPSSNAGSSDVRMRKASSSSSSSSVRSLGRVGANAAGRYESFGQRVNHSATEPATPRRHRTSSSISSSSQVAPIATASSSHSLERIAHRELQQDETVQLDPFPDASMDLITTSTDFDHRLSSSSPLSEAKREGGRGEGIAHRSPPHQDRSPLPQQTPPPLPSSTRTPILSGSGRSRLPRPVSVMYQGVSPLASTPRHAQRRSLDAHPSTVALESEQQVPSAPPANVEAAVVGAHAGTAKLDKPTASSSGVKWFLGKASQLDHTDVNRDAEDTSVDVQLSPVKKRPESDVWISQLQSGQADVRTFKGLAGLCKEFKLPERAAGDEAEREDGEDDVMLRPGRLPSQSALGLMQVHQTRTDEQIAVKMWQQGNLFERLFASLSTFLCAKQGAGDAASTPAPSSTKDLKTAALIVLHRLVENQFRLFEVMGKERELIQLVFELIRANKTSNVKSACQAIMESWSEQTNVLIGISALRGIITTSGEVKLGDEGRRDSSSSSSSSLSLRTLSRLFAKLPIEIVEEEVHRCKAILKEGLNHWNIETRQQAVSVLVAANAKVHDPKSLFVILQPMDKAQEDLLMYYMSKG